MAAEMRVETADSGAAKVSAAGKSLARWFRQEVTTLAKMKQIARAEIEAGRGDVEESRRSLADIERQEAELAAGWKRSTLRLHIEEVARKSETDRQRPGGIETRVAVATSAGLTLPTEDRGAGTGTGTTAKSLVGHAAVFNQWAVIGGWFRERIAPGAFANAIKTSDVRFLFNHDANYIYGRSTAATLELSEDRIGLAFTCHLLPFDGALARRIDRGDITGCSFSFTVARESWKLATKEGELDERTIEEIATLYDVGCVTYPAYPQTDVQAIFEKVPARSSAPVRADDGGYEEFSRRYEAEENAAFARLARASDRLAGFQRRQHIRRQYSRAMEIIARNTPGTLEWKSREIDRIIARNRKR